MNTKSLFARLGGTKGISALVDDIAALHIENPLISARFRPLLNPPEKIEKTKQHLCDFLEMGSGGPAEYSGRSMPETHRGMNVSEAEYVAVLDDIISALNKHGIDEQTQKDVLWIAYSLKREIIHL
jgi:hemoglobin